MFFVVLVVIDDVVVIPNKSKVYSLLLVLGLSLEIDNNLGVGVAGEMYKGCWGVVQRLPGRCAREQK